MVRSFLQNKLQHLAARMANVFAMFVRTVLCQRCNLKLLFTVPRKYFWNDGCCRSSKIISGKKKFQVPRFPFLSCGFANFIRCFFSRRLRGHFYNELLQKFSIPPRVLGVLRAWEHLSVVCSDGHRCECVTCASNNTRVSDASHYAIKRRKSRFWRTRGCILRC